MNGLRYSPLHVTEFCGEMQGKFKVGLAQLIKYRYIIAMLIVARHRIVLLDDTVLSFKSLVHFDKR